MATQTQINVGHKRSSLLACTLSHDTCTRDVGIRRKVCPGIIAIRSDPRSILQQCIRREKTLVSSTSAEKSVLAPTSLCRSVDAVAVRTVGQLLCRAAWQVELWFSANQNIFNIIVSRTLRTLINLVITFDGMISTKTIAMFLDPQLTQVRAINQSKLSTPMILEFIRCLSTALSYQGISSTTYE